MVDRDDDRVRPIDVVSVRPRDAGTERRASALPIGLIGVLVGLALGVLLGPRQSSDGTSGLPADPTTAPSATVNAAPPTTAAAGPDETARSRELVIEELEVELARAQDRLLEVGLQVDPPAYAPVAGCDQSATFADETALLAQGRFVGPLAFSGFEEVSPGAGVYGRFAVVESSDAITLVVPESERARYSLIWDPATWQEDAAYVVADGSPAVTLRACELEPTTFVGGIVAGTPYCAPLDVYVGDDPSPRRVALALDAVDCPDGPLALATPARAPAPDMVGRPLRRARLEIRLAGLSPEVERGDPMEPDSLVWAQEPNDGATYPKGTVVGLRTCRPAGEVLTTYRGRLNGTGVDLSRGWMAPSHDEQLESWYFVSALVIGSASDRQVATWALPPWALPADALNTPSLSFPVNDVARGLGFGDSRFRPESFGVSGYADIDAAVASQQCVTASRR
jgi:hypothetical protein